MRELTRTSCVLISLLTLISIPSIASAEPAAQEPDSTKTLSSHVDWFWTCIAAFLVFFMQAGFALVEGGFVRSKNVVNIMMKNLADLSVGALAFWAIGFGVMFSGSAYEFFPNPDVNSFGEDPNWMYAFLLFQTVFAATAATIVSGAVAERTKFGAYLIFSAVITTLIYPFAGSWAWGGLWHGGGWLEKMGFVDFAGSTVVHSVGGWAALAGAIVLGPRIGKFNKDGSANPIVGHNMGMAALGVFILWLGWFGFNGGSTTSMDSGAFARVALLTNLSAAGGAFGALTTCWIKFKYPDISMTLNGALGGLVGITAGCYTMTPTGAIIVGMLSGVLVVLSILFIERLGVDDPVGAVSVHGVCGAWGTLACAIPFFCRPGEAAPITAQLAGVGAVFAFVFPGALLLFWAIKKTVGLRVASFEEIEGLDLLEHGMSGYTLHTQNLKHSLISKVPFLRGASNQLLRDVSQSLRPRVFKAGEIVFRAGTRGKEMFFIHQGSLSVLSPDEKTTLATLGDGDFFGEIALLNEQPRMATVKTLAYCEVYVLDKTGFDTVMADHPEFADQMKQVATERLRGPAEPPP